MKESFPQTVFIVGAGASKEVDLPLGTELKGRIANQLDIRFELGYRQVSGDSDITEALRTFGQLATPPFTNINPYLHAARRISYAMPQAISIDNFIDSHGDDEMIALCGKLAIAKSILDAERSSKIYFDRTSGCTHPNFSALEATWFNSFFQLLTENCRRDDVGARLKSIAFVVFNYDRCLEQYLHSALENYYGMSPTDAADACRGLEIHHPYGKVGPLSSTGAQMPIDFGQKLSARRLLDVSSQLKTFTEGTDPSDVVYQRVTQLTANASRLVFLGFAFHRLNIDLLFPSPPSANAKSGRLYATAFGMSSSDVEDVAEVLQLRTGFPNERMRIGNQLTCSGLFKEHWRALTFSLC